MVHAMPRLSARRCLVGWAGLALVLLSCALLHQTGLLSQHLLPGQYADHQPSPNRHTQTNNDRRPPQHNRRTTNQQQGSEDEYSGSGGEKEVAEGAAARPWYMSGGSVLPAEGGPKPKLWPQQEPGADRITQQLMFRPADSLALKRVLLYNGLGSWSPHKPGRAPFAHCPVHTCVLTANKAESQKADAILYKDHFVHPGHHKPNKQVWILYLLECPYHTQHMKFNDVFNWTATYRRDSDIVAPYERWVYHDEKVRQAPLPLSRNYAANKTRQVAWFVSNCGARNGRLQYARELQKFISVDIFGACGSKKCPRSNQEKCFEMLDNEYKFYLAFENSNCKDYITEKFFVNGLGRNILPIVMGARPEDYERSAPYRSYIHVDEFPSPKELAHYLHKLDADDDLYNSYFRWKGTGEFINTHFFCRLCALLHDDFPSKSYRDINEWWRGPGTCTTGSWRKHNWQSPRLSS